MNLTDLDGTSLDCTRTCGRILENTQHITTIVHGLLQREDMPFENGFASLVVVTPHCAS